MLTAFTLRKNASICMKCKDVWRIKRAWLSAVFYTLVLDPLGLTSRCRISKDATVQRRRSTGVRVPGPSNTLGWGQQVDIVHFIIMKMRGERFGTSIFAVAWSQGKRMMLANYIYYDVSLHKAAMTLSYAATLIDWLIFNVTHNKRIHVVCT